MQIAQEFIGKYIEWLNDHNNADLTDREYGNKYGWGKFSEPQKDTQKHCCGLPGTYTKESTCTNGNRTG